MPVEFRWNGPRGTTGEQMGNAVEKTTAAGWAMAILVMGLLVLLGGCTPEIDSPPETPLVQVGAQTITDGDFFRAFEINKAAFAHNAIQTPAAARVAKTRLLRQLIEEAILIDQADARGIRLSEEELEQALTDFRRDYPGESFEQMLLESAISFSDWKAMLRKRLRIEKLIDEVLGKQIVISSEEIAADYHRFADSAGMAEEARADDETGERLNEIIVARLRRRKLEQAYAAWLADLFRQYTVTVDKDRWREIAGIDAEPVVDPTANAGKTN